VEELRTFAKNPKESPDFCPFLEPVALSEP